MLGGGGQAGGLGPWRTLWYLLSLLASSLMKEKVKLQIVITVIILFDHASINFNLRNFLNELS